MSAKSVAVHATCCSARVVARRRSRGRSPIGLLLTSVTWLHPPRGRVVPLTVVYVPGHIGRCLPCHLADRDGLTQVTRGDRDDRVNEAALRAALPAWNVHVRLRQPVPGSVEAWHALRCGLEHVVGLNDACMKTTIAVTMMPTTATVTAPSSCVQSHLSGNVVSSLVCVAAAKRTASKIRASTLKQ